MWFSKMLKDKSSQLKKARKIYFLKLMHNELAMVSIFTQKGWENVHEYVT